MPEQEKTNGRFVPRASRPNMHPDYGIKTSDEGLLDWSWVSEQMEKSHNYWVCSARPDGRPHAMPVWGVWMDETLYFSTGRNSRKGRNLAENPEVVIHLESGNEAVIFEGRVEEVKDVALLRRMAEVYGAKYPGFTPSPEEEPQNVYYALRPRVAFGWLERDYTNSATRWQFE